MASYVVLTAPEPADEGSDVIAVRDGFSWLAFLFGPFWCVGHRMWLTTAACILVGFGLFVVADATGEVSLTLLLSVLFILWLGLEGNGLRIAGWLRRGWHIQAIVEAPDRDTAEAIFYSASGSIAAAAARSYQPSLPIVPVAPQLSARRGIEGSARPALGFIDYDEGR